MWKDILIIFVCLLSSVILPLMIYESLKKIRFNPEKETLSFLSNHKLFGKKMSDGYTEVLFVTAVLSFFFFWLLIRKLNFQNDQTIWEWIIISLGSLILLAFARHNTDPFNWRNLYQNIIRTLHNILAVIVFISLPVLIVKFDLFLLADNKITAISGLIITGLTIAGTLFSLFKLRKLTGITEISFISGICLWNIVTALFVVL